MPQITAQNLAVICCTVARQKSFITFGPRSLLSKSIGPDEIGKVFSILAVLASLGPVAGNAMFRQLYNNTIATFPGSIFLPKNGVFTFYVNFYPVRTFAKSEMIIFGIFIRGSRKKKIKKS